jgi:hypothetical protein
VHYYDATAEEWVDLTNYATGFKVEDQGIIKVPSTTINFETARSNLNDYLSNPYRLIRIRANPGSWQNLFYGYVDECYIKTIPGTITERSVMSLDCLSFAARLAEDYITLDYYALQSALTPYTGAATWTFRDMIEDFLETPDSRYPTTGFDYGTGFEVEATTDTNGIDHLIDAVGTWDNQTLWEAIRLIAEHIGYDGYHYLANETSTPKIRLYPFNKASIYTLTNPFIKEPEWRSGSLADIGNMIFVEGGVDSGIPSDGDRFTEYGVSKYSPAAWSVTMSGTTPTIDDIDNTTFSDALKAGNKCIRVDINASTGTAQIILDFTKTEYPLIDIDSRFASINLAIYPYKVSDTGTITAPILRVYLYDTNGSAIMYKAVYSRSFFGTAENGYPFSVERLLSIPLPANPIYNQLGLPETDNKWNYVSGSLFNAQVTSMKITVTAYGVYTDHWGLLIDGLQFIGGIKIDQFNALNPPAVDLDSISGNEEHPGYGVHPFKHNDSQITSFEQAQAEAARILNNMHNPIPTLKCTKLLPTTQLYPSNVVKVATIDYRIANIIYEWHAKNKWVEATYNMVTKTSPLPQIWTQDNELRYLIK